MTVHKNRLGRGGKQVTYFGHGPGENYADRLVGSAVGRFETTVKDLFVPYIVPSENGTRAGVRWAALTCKVSLSLSLSLSLACLLACSRARACVCLVSPSLYDILRGSLALALSLCVTVSMIVPLPPAPQPCLSV